ncbi:GNAT family N-acetyltransferase [Clostridium manihotivorum]|uniref:GNAT family N-acetyltransferase n=1 Tax=Clostridium manihotivorum TaxID=2320868 RepID=A0A3R5X2X4_9CLOT|nr:GNAT family N-acetyltransferase [Clostridium manihotivorum]QAA33150.1 GNAT family N-acetyltransferase [Clostridium manihotivorum]
MSMIRYATVDDFYILGTIHCNSWKVAYKDIVPKQFLDNITVEKRAAYFEKALREKTETDAILFDTSEPVGFITFGKCRDKDKANDFGEIWGLYLLPNRWRKGYGKELMNFAIEALRNLGFKKVSLWVLEENLSAIRFYEKLGFLFDGTVKELNIGKAINECRYVKTI